MKRKMSSRQQDKILATLSKRAQRLFDLIRNEHRFYKSYQKDTPKAMQELVLAGLVGEAGRVNVIVRCYVPMKGFKPFRMEEWDRN